MTVVRRGKAAARFARAVIREVRRTDLPFMAASLAYYAFVSLLPLLLLLLVVFSTIGGDVLAASVTDLAKAYLTPQGRRLVTDAIANSTGETGASVLGVVVLVWSALRVFRATNIAFARIYGTNASQSLLDQLRNGFVVLVAIGCALAVMTTTGAAFAVFRDVPYVGVLSPVVLIAGLTVVFLPMYYLFPNADVSVREVVPGALVAAVGLASLEALFGLYVSAASQYAAYGVIGAVILLVTWLYFGGFVLLFGVVVNVVAAGRAPEPERTEEPSRWRAAVTRSRRLWRSERGR